MNGCSRTFWTSVPWASPITPPRASTAGTANHGSRPCSTSSQGRRHPISAITEPIDRSMPPTMMTNAAPIEMTPKSEVRRSRFSML